MSFLKPPIIISLLNENIHEYDKLHKMDQHHTLEYYPWKISVT